MKIYKLNQLETKTIKWKCPITGIYILGHFMGNDAIEYGVFSENKSFYDSFENFYHAKNWVKKHVDKRFSPPRLGEKVNENKLASSYDLKKESMLRGEWWIIDGMAHYADGDIGDFNHEAYAIQHAENLLMDGETEDWEEWKSIKAYQLFQNIKDNYDKDAQWDMKQEVDNDPELFILNHIEESDIDETTFFVANGNHKDPRTWSMKELGWKRMAGNEITTWTLTSSDLSSISNGIWDAFPEDNLDNEKFNIEVASNNRMFWGVPIEVIESGNIRKLSEYGAKSNWGVFSEGKVKFYKLSKKINIISQNINTIKTIAYEVRNMIIKKESDLATLCLPVSRHLAKTLNDHGYSNAIVIKGLFAIDNPDPSYYDEWDVNDFENEKEMESAMYNTLHYWVQIGNLVIDITGDQFNDELNQPFPPVVVQDKNSLDRYTIMEEDYIEPEYMRDWEILS